MKLKEENNILKTPPFISLPVILKIKTLSKCLSWANYFNLKFDQSTIRRTLCIIARDTINFLTLNPKSGCTNCHFNRGYVFYLEDQ